MNTSWVIAKKKTYPPKTSNHIHPSPEHRFALRTKWLRHQLDPWRLITPVEVQRTEFRPWFKQCLLSNYYGKHKKQCILQNILYSAVILVCSGSEELIYSWNNISTSCLLKNIRIYPRIKLCSSRYQELVHIQVQYMFFSQKQHNVRFPVCSFPPLPFLCLFNIHPHFHGKRTAPTTSESSQVVPKGFLQLGLPPPIWRTIWNRFVSTPAKRESIKTAEE